MTTTAPRTLADQIRYCADQLTTATLLDRPNIVAATLRDLAEKVRDTESERNALKQVSRGYCLECGRGDAAPSVEDWQRERDRADQAERERDRQWQLKEIALGELASVRLLAEQIRRLAEWPATITALPAEIAQALRYHALQLARLLGTGGPQDGAESHQEPRT